MSKAEELAEIKYPVLNTQLGDLNYLPRIGYIEGYHQAEQDLELSWQDIVMIDKLLIDLGMMFPCKSTPDYYQEVLKRFKDFKERKEK